MTEHTTATSAARSDTSAAYNAADDAYRIAYDAYRSAAEDLAVARAARAEANADAYRDARAAAAVSLAAYETALFAARAGLDPQNPQEIR